jgi:hypothetical protein
MGLDLNSIFQQAKQAADQGMNDLLQTGGNAAIGYLEQQAVNVISADQAQHVEQSQQAITTVLNRPSKPDGFGAYLTNLMQQPALKNYGPYLIAGVVAIVALTLFVRGK